MRHLSLDLEGMEELTTFADYRVPQLLRHVGILSYNRKLSEMVDSKVELTKSKEVSIRAATVVAVDQLVASVQSNQEYMNGSTKNDGGANGLALVASGRTTQRPRRNETTSSSQYNLLLTKH